MGLTNPHRFAAQRIRRILGADDTPERLAVAWALGVAIGLSPLLGLHTAIALLLAYILRLNKVDVLLGTLIINPWTLTVYFPAAAFLGRWLTGVPLRRIEIPRLADVLDAAAWRERAQWLKPLLLAWGVGAGVIALLAGAATFFLLRRFIVRHRESRAHRLASSTEP
jgi:uncharacterized protein (DUF2062 family)